jgi:hypothetical protein
MAAKILFVTLAVAMAFVLGSVTRAQNPAPLAMVPVFYADGSAVAGVHIVIGRISIGEGPPHPVKLPRPPLEEFPVTFSNAAAFSNADSYNCFLAQPYGAGQGGIIRRVDGGQFVYRGMRSGRGGNRTSCASVTRPPVPPNLYDRSALLDARGEAGSCCRIGSRR